MTHDYPKERVFTCFSFGRGSSVGLFPMTGDRIYWWFTENVLEKDLEGFESKMIQEASPEEKQRRIISVLEKKRWFAEGVGVIQKCDPDSIICNPIFDRLPLPVPWGWDCVTLLGDAAHPTSPILGQVCMVDINDVVMVCFSEGDNLLHMSFHILYSRVYCTVMVLILDPDFPSEILCKTKAQTASQVSSLVQPHSHTQHM